MNNRDNTQETKQWRHVFIEAISFSWLAWAALFGYIAVEISHGNPLVAGGLILAAAILAMNGLARTDFWLTSRGPNWWRHHKYLRFFHHITDEGELAGIFIGLIALSLLYFNGAHEHIHFAYKEAFTLLGIMSAANLAVLHMMPVMSFLEKIGGVKLVIIGGSLLSSLTGEPAASVFLADYLKKRVDEKDRAKLATGLATTIGSGGSFMPFAAPPILIVWGVLASKFGWGIPELISFVGVGCFFHVFITTFRFSKYIKIIEPTTKKMSSKGVIYLILLSIVILWHIFYPSTLLWIFDAIIGFTSWFVANKKYKNCNEDDMEEAFTAKWQPLILAALLMALEIIGIVADPLITTIAQQIPTTWPPLAIAFALFFITTWTSHFADNALASRVFIMIPVALIPVFSQPIAALLAASVIMGALFGGFLMIPANLPNFYLARAFKVTPGAWIRVSWHLYLTIIAYIGWIVLKYFLIT